MADQPTIDLLAVSPIEPEPVAPNYGCHISLARIIALSIVSLGFYWFYWMYCTWRHCRDHTGEHHYPVWHGLTQGVPIYGFFRFYSHIETYKILMQKRGIRDRLLLGPLTVIVVIFTLVQWRGLAVIRVDQRILAPEVFGVSIDLILTISALIISIAVLCWIQSNINRYWASCGPPLTRHARIGKGEVLVAIIGVVLWILGSLGTVRLGFLTFTLQ